MSARTRIALAAVVAALSLAVAVAPASAGKNGPNNVNAKKCQSYQDWVRADGSAFQSSDQCTAYAAKGGALVAKPPPFAGQAACAAAGGTFLVGTAPRLWVCNGSFASEGARALEVACFADLNAAGLEGGITFGFEPPPYAECFIIG